MNNKEILMHLKKFIEAQKENESDKKMQRTVKLLEDITEEDITIGEEPKYFNAYIECNSTGVGESSFEGTKTQRTVALDYRTDEYLFIEGHVGAGVKGLNLLVLKPGETTTYHSADDIVKVAKQYGFKLHAQNFRDLNYSMTNHRLNRHTVHITKGPKSYPIRPIMARVNDKGDIYTIGYLYVKEGAEYILIEPERIEKFKNSLGLKPWMLLGFILPPVFIVAVAVVIINYVKNKGIG